MHQSTHKPAAASIVQALVDATRHLVGKMDRKGFFSEQELARYDALIADAEATASRLGLGTVLYAVILSDSGAETVAFDTHGDRRAFLAHQDECGDDVYTLDVGPDRGVEMSLANIGEFADTAPIEPTVNLPPAQFWTDTDNPSVSAIFLWQGLGDKAKTEMTDGLGGQIGIADWLMSYAAICERNYKTLANDLPGVFHYEIVEAMGVWLGKEESQPSDQAFAAELDRRINAWLEELQPKITA